MKVFESEFRGAQQDSNLQLFVKKVLTVEARQARKKCCQNIPYLLKAAQTPSREPFCRCSSVTNSFVIPKLLTRITTKIVHFVINRKYFNSDLLSSNHGTFYRY